MSLAQLRQQRRDHAVDIERGGAGGIRLDAFLDHPGDPEADEQHRADQDDAAGDAVLQRQRKRVPSVSQMSNQLHLSIWTPDNTKRPIPSTGAARKQDQPRQSLKLQRRGPDIIPDRAQNLFARQCGRGPPIGSALISSGTRPLDRAKSGATEVAQLSQPTTRACPRPNSRRSAMHWSSQLLTVASIWSIATVCAGCRISAHGAGRRGPIAAARAGGRRRHRRRHRDMGHLRVAWDQALFIAAPWAFVTLKLAGALYLVFTGARLIAYAGKAPRAAPIAAGLSPRRAFGIGLVTSLANPRSALSVASVFAVALPAQPSLPIGVAAAALMVAISVGWYICVAYMFASRHRREYVSAAAPLDRPHCRRPVGPVRSQAGARSGIGRGPIGQPGANALTGAAGRLPDRTGRRGPGRSRW